MEVSDEKFRRVTARRDARVWSEVFHRSRISPYVFVVDKTAEGDVLEAVEFLALPEAYSAGVFSNTHLAWPLLDGAVTRLHTYGLPPLPSRVRVYGHAPMRLLCDLLDLKPPTRRLKGEGDIPSRQELRGRLQAQRRVGREDLLEQAIKAMADDARDVVAAVRSLFGEEAAALGKVRGVPSDS